MGHLVVPICMLLLGGPEDGVVGTWFAGTSVKLYHEPMWFRDLTWECRRGDDILVHRLREEADWLMIDANGELPCALE